MERRPGCPWLSSGGAGVGVFGCGRKIDHGTLDETKGQGQENEADEEAGEERRMPSWQHRPWRQEQNQKGLATQEKPKCRSEGVALQEKASPQRGAKAPEELKKAGDGGSWLKLSD
jgi:hypothetical protein